jgi:hypothetical protein
VVWMLRDKPRRWKASERSAIESCALKCADQLLMRDVCLLARICPLRPWQAPTLSK